MRVIPWQPGTALVLADVTDLGDGTAPAPGPGVARQVLRAQLELGGGAGWTALAGTELEFVVYEGSYEQAWTPATTRSSRERYNADYSVLGTGGSSRCCATSGTRWPTRACTSSPPKASAPGAARDRVPLRGRADHRRPALDLQDRREEIAARHGYALTFMAKPNEREGNSATSTCRSGRRRLRGHGRRRAVRPVAPGPRWSGPARRAARADLLLGRRSTPQAVRPGASAPPRSPGGRTTGPARCGWSGTGRRCASSAGYRR